MPYSKPEPRILIAGAGALGSVFGGLLRQRGHDVTLLGRAEHVEAIRRHGLHIDGIWGEHRAEGLACASEGSQLQGPFDAALVCVKSYDTGAVADAIAPLLAADAVVLSLQNGLGNVEALEERFGAGRVLGARVIFGATLLAPGRARVTVYAEPVLVGPWSAGADDPRHAAARDWAARFAACGIPSEATDRLPAALWAKVFYNAALNPLGALLGVHYGALPERPEVRAAMDRVIDEAFAVAVAEGVALPWADADAYRAVFYDRLVPSTRDHRSSMLQDLERGRPTEVDAINGAIWHRAAARSMSTPYNETLTRLVHSREQAR
jgi:2-dehydropantoate 2-reductase